MPRIRKLKDFSHLRCDEMEAPDEHDTLQEGSQNPAPAVGGWWSDLAIIQSMPDAKLREAIARYKTLLRSLEQEAARRVVSGVSVRATAQFDVIYGMHRFVNVGREVRVSRRAVAVEGNTVAKRRQRSSTKQLKLTPQQMIKALELLLSIKTKDT